MNVDDRELADRMIGLQFMLGPENDDGTKPYRCTILQYEPRAVLVEPKPQVPGRTVEPAGWDTAVCSVEPPLREWETGHAVCELRIDLSERFVEAILDSERTTDGANVVCFVPSPEGEKKVWWRWLVWTVGWSPYVRNPVSIMMDDGRHFAGSLVFSKPAWLSETFDVVDRFFHLVEPAWGAAEGWDWILVGDAQPVDFGKVEGLVGLANGPEPTSFDACQSIVGRGVMTIMPVEHRSEV